MASPSSIDNILRRCKRTTTSIAAMEEEIQKRNKQPKKIKPSLVATEEEEEEIKAKKRGEEQFHHRERLKQVEEETEWIKNYYIVKDLPKEQQDDRIFWINVSLGPFVGKYKKPRHNYEPSHVSSRVHHVIKLCTEYNRILARHRDDRFAAQDAYSKWRGESFLHFEAALIVASRTGKEE